MDLEEHEGIDTVADRCEECGAKLTPEEMQAVLENGGPALCTIHAADVVPVSEEETETGGGEPY